MVLMAKKGGPATESKKPFLFTLMRIKLTKSLHLGVRRDLDRGHTAVRLDVSVRSCGDGTVQVARTAFISRKE